MIHCSKLLLLLIVVLPAILLAHDEEQAARRLTASQQFSEARELYLRLVERDPWNLDYLLWVARLSAWMKEYEKALATYDRALERDPKNAEALVGKAYVWMWQGRFSNAREILILAERLAPANPEVQVAFARWCYYQHQTQAARERLATALRIDPENQDASKMQSEIRPPGRFELRAGYGLDHFSFATPGQMGQLGIAYVGETGRIGLQYEEWSRFEQRVRREGVDFAKKWGSGWWLRGGGVWGPGAVVLPRREYTAGFSRALPRRFVLDADYRYLGFRSARVHLLAPAVSYYFAKPFWIQATFYNSWTTGTSTRVNQSWFLQYYQQIRKAVVLHAGYARGTETFTVFSIDRLGNFMANTYVAGADIRLSRAYTTGLFCAYQSRSNGLRETSAGVNLTVKW